MIRRIAIAGVVCLVLAAPAFAATYTIEITRNGGGPHDPSRVEKVKVRGATPEDHPGPKDQTGPFSIEVTMPDGVCQSRVTLFLRIGIGKYPSRTDLNYNVCSEVGIRWGQR